MRHVRVGMIVAAALCTLHFNSAVRGEVAPPATAPVVRPDHAKATAEMAAAASKLLATLDAEQRAKCVFDFAADERLNWHFIPKPRKGLMWRDMTPDQRGLAKTLLASGLSQRANGKVLAIMSLEVVLKEIEKGSGPTRDPELYYLSIFGKPGPAQTWGWRVEGHHLSVNVAIIDGMAVAGAPTFFGTNPAKILSGPRKGERILDKEEDLGRQLVKMLTDEQRKAAVVAAKAPADIITGNQRKAKLLEPRGIAWADLTPPQREALTALVEEYARRLRDDVADTDLKRIAVAGLDKLAFAWAGGLEVGDPHYYRVQGPTFLIEYDNTQNNANHVHAVWRDLERDFGEDLLRSHYDHDHGPAKK